MITVEKIEVVETNPDVVKVSLDLGKDLTLNLNYTLLKDLDTADVSKEIVLILFY